MSKYFAKYLPVEGEIKWEAITAKNEHGYPLFIVEGKVIAASDVRDGTVWCHFKAYKAVDCRCVKLFLCSRDIEEHDVVDNVHGDEKGTVVHIYPENAGYEVEVNDTMTIYKPHEIFKVIGEISPDAKWVKEGAEFSEDEVIPFWRISIETWSSAHKGNDVMDLGSERYPEYFTEERIKTILQYYCDENYISAKTVEKPFVTYYELKGPCGHFH